VLSYCLVLVLVLIFGFGFDSECFGSCSALESSRPANTMAHHRQTWTTPPPTWATRTTTKQTYVCNGIGAIGTCAMEVREGTCLSPPGSSAVNASHVSMYMCNHQGGACRCRFSVRTGASAPSTVSTRPSRRSRWQITSSGESATAAHHEVVLTEEPPTSSRVRQRTTHLPRAWRSIRSRRNTPPLRHFLEGSRGNFNPRLSTRTRRMSDEKASAETPIFFVLACGPGLLKD
jgi:hypothetical protein